jgi:tRNA-splicing ligase RtcB
MGGRQRPSDALDAVSDDGVMEQITPRLLSWASVIDEQSLEQARRTAEMPFVFPHVALMPDAHPGLGATVGSVIPTDHAIIPAAVGVDIGCGMIAVLTQFRAEDLAGHPLRPLRQSIERAIPLSAGVANRRVVATAAPRVAALEAEAEAAGLDPARHSDRWREQLGTLGSGNHFIEVSLDERDRVWAFLHSGSRGVGNKIAQHHIEVARRQMQRDRVHLPDRDLAYLVEGSAEFDAYIRHLRWAQHYALLNREEMMDRVVRQLGEFLGTPVIEAERVNCHHNFTQWRPIRAGRCGCRARAPSRHAGASPASSRGRWAPVPTSSRASATRPPSSRRPTGRGGSSPGPPRAGSSPATSCGRRWWASSTATPTPSWTRSPRPTRTSTA